MLNSLLYATSFTIFRGEMGGGGRTVERFWRFREIKRTLNEKEKHVKQFLATISANKWTKGFINRKEEKDVDWLNALMTFKHCQTLQGLELTILRSVLLPNDTRLIINFSLRSWWFFRANAQLSCAPLPYPSPRKPPVTRTNAMFTPTIPDRFSCQHGIVWTRYSVNMV